MYVADTGDGGDRGGDGGVTLLAQLANMPSMSPLITSPVPSVGSVVPNITPSVLSQQQPQTSLPTTIVITANGLTQQAPEVCSHLPNVTIAHHFKICRLLRMWRYLLKWIIIHLHLTIESMKIHN